MQQRDPNYGSHREPQFTQVPVGMSPQDERTWSMLAHLSVLVNLITGIGGPIAALIIWLVYKDRSQRVAFHALQSLWYQVAWFIIITLLTLVYVVISLILTLVVIGVFLLALTPFVPPLIALVPLAHQCYAAY